jgi:hypothetical protein
MDYTIARYRLAASLSRGAAVHGRGGSAEKERGAM